MDHFVARENNKCISTQLKSELHSNLRSHVQKLLVSEEYKLGLSTLQSTHRSKVLVTGDCLLSTVRCAASKQSLAAADNRLCRFCRRSRRLDVRLAERKISGSASTRPRCPCRRRCRPANHRTSRG